MAKKPAKKPAKKLDPTEYQDGELNKKTYEKELARLQEELVKLQYWIKDRGLKVCVIFEGRDAAGKGGVIKLISHRLNPRIARGRSPHRPNRARAGAVVLPA